MSYGASEKIVTNRVHRKMNFKNITKNYIKKVNP